MSHDRELPAGILPTVTYATASGYAARLREVEAERDALAAKVAGLSIELGKAMRERDDLKAAISEHHRQKADDRCWMDDLPLYAAAQLPPPDIRVGDKAAMRRNCDRFIDRRCEDGGWPTYAELEAALADALARAVRAESLLSQLGYDPDPAGGRKRDDELLETDPC